LNPCRLSDPKSGSLPRCDIELWLPGVPVSFLELLLIRWIGTEIRALVILVGPFYWFAIPRRPAAVRR
jgi:hypothetical protein